MNRKARRAMARQGLPTELKQALQSIGPMQEFMAVTDQLRPLLEEIQSLSEKLDAAYAALQLAEKQADRQRQTTIRLLAHLTGRTEGEVAAIEASLTQTEDPHADTIDQDHTPEGTP